MNASSLTRNALLSLGVLLAAACGDDGDGLEGTYECYSTTDCGLNQECSGGTCVAVVACTSDADCEGAETCSGGFCRASCSTEADCSDQGLTCDAATGLCMPLPNPTPGSGGNPSTGGNGSGASGTGGNGSGGSSGGTGGSGGGSSGGGTTGPTYDLIDDLEDGDVKIEETDGRVGYWYSYNEAYARPRLSAPSSSDGGHAIHATGSHQGGVQEDAAYGGLGVDLKNPDPSDEGPRSDSRQPYDATAWDGFEFRIRAGSGTTKSIRFEVVTTQIAESSENGTCNGEGCWDAYGFDVSLTTEWRTVKVPFDDLVQEGWGKSVSFEPSSILGIAFEDLTTGSWDFWVDDVKFYEGGAGGGGGGGFDPECSGSWGEETNGSLTWYTFDQGTVGFGDINCSYGIQTNPDRVNGIQTGGGEYFGAMNTADYDTAAACGACVEISADNGSSVVVTIVDQCPIDTNPKCVSGHIDLSKAAYDSLNLSAGYYGQRAGVGSVSWKYVPCDVTGSVTLRLKEPSNQYWNQILVENHVYPIASVEVEVSRDGSLTWVNATREEFNYWLPPGGRMGTYKVRVTDINGNQVVETVSLQSGAQDTGEQFVCD